MDDKTALALLEAIQQQTEYLKQMNVKATPAQFHTATLLHGPGGIFSTPGIERDVITAHIRCEGISKVLQKIPSVSVTPYFPALTGFTDVIGDEPANACDDAPYGYMKSCLLTAQFGLLRRDTGTIEMDKVMLKNNRGDMTDLILRGRVLGLMDDIRPDGLNEAQLLNIVTMAEMVTVGVNVERALSTQYWQGTVAAGQFPGLDVQIATGQVDAVLNTACQALDSDVKDFAYNDVCGNGLDIVEYVSMLEYYIRYNARKMGLDPATWVFVMRPELWYELTACWPCRYNTYRCGVLDTAMIDAVPQVDAAAGVRERDAMRDGLFIVVNGNRYPVVIDDGIFEFNNANNANLDPGEFASSIYMVPLTIQGGFPVTYIEYVDYRQAAMDAALLRGKEDWWWTDAGMYSWAIEQIKWCYKLSIKTEQRIVLRAPHLAGRIDHVLYSPLQHLRTQDPDSPYFADGGASVGRRPRPAHYSVWDGR